MKLVPIALVILGFFAAFTFLSTSVNAVAPPDYSNGYCEVRFGPGSSCDTGGHVIYCDSGYQCDWSSCQDWSPSVCGCQVGIECTDTFNQRCLCVLSGSANCGSNNQPCCNGNLCYSGMSCQSNICISGTGCGDTICDKSIGEDVQSDPDYCPQDCGGCGDGACSGSETCSSCETDCGTCSGGGNKPPVLSSISTNVTLIRNGTPVKISSVASDPDGNQVRLICGTKTWARDICVGGITNKNPSCNFVANWTDDSNHSVFCVIRDIVGGTAKAWSNSAKTVVTVLNSPVLDSIAANPSSGVADRTQIVVSSVGKDPLFGAPAGSERVKLVCNDLFGAGLCSGVFAASNPSCSFLSQWVDEASHSIHCKIIDASNFISYEKITSVSSISTLPVLDSISLSPSSGSIGTNVNVISSGSGKNKNIQLICGFSSGVSDLCTSVFVTSNPSCSFSSPWADETQHIVYCVLKDTSGLLSDEKTDIFTAINKPSLTSISAQPSTGASGIQITINSIASDPGAEQVKLLCGSSSGASDLCTGVFAASNPSCSFSSPWTDELQHTIYCVVKDTAGILSDEKTDVFAAVNKPSLTSISAQPSTGAPGIQITINSIASDPGAEQVKLICGSSSGASDLCTGEFAASNPSCSFLYSWADGLAHAIYCSVQDQSLLFSSEQTAQINPNPLPVLTSVSASPVIVKIGDQVTVTSVGSDPEGENVTLLCGTVSGSSNLCVGVPSALNPSCTFEAQTWPDGPADIFCSISDIYGQNSNEKTFMITNDNSPPSLSASHSPPSPYVTTGTTPVTITATSSDPSGISDIKLYLDGLLVNQCTASPCSYIADKGVGTYSYSSSATDTLGNSGSTAVQYFTVLQAAQVTAISLSDTCPSDVGTVDVRCTSSVPDVNCIAAKIGNVDCVWNSNSRWEGNDAVFAGCSPGAESSSACGAGAVQATCYVQTDKCVKLGNNVSAGMDIKNTSGICSVYNSSTNCSADVNCKWINFCSLSEKSSLPYQCVTKAATGTYECRANSCGAGCDDSVGCAPKNINGVCYYSGSCQNNCACDYTSQQNCPAPGTVQGTTCYYGTNACTNTGCGLLTQQLSVNSRCDPVQGSVVDNNVLQLLGKIEFSDNTPTAGEIVHAKLSCEVRNRLYPQLNYMCTQANTKINSINVDQEIGVTVKKTMEAEMVRASAVRGPGVLDYKDCGLIEGGTSVNLCNKNSSLKFSYLADDGVLTLKIRAKGSGTLQLLIDGAVTATKAIESSDYTNLIVSASAAEGDRTVVLNRTSGSIQIDAIAVISGVIDAISRENWVQGANWNAVGKYWAIDFDTNIYHSCPNVNMSSGNASNTTAGCYETQFVRHIDVSATFPDEQYLPKENNIPVFYKPMLLRTEATGKIINTQTGETETCTNANCVASYSIDNGTYVPMSYNTAENAFYAEPSTAGLACNAVHTIKIKITKTTEPESGASGSSERSFVIKCERKLLVLPNEKRAGLMYSGKIFNVDMINPDAGETFEIAMSVPKNDFILGNLTFVCHAGAAGCSVSPDAKTVTMQIPDESVGTAYVYVTITRAGSYPIDFKTSDGLYTGRGTLQVYAESLPDFGIVQLFAIILITPLLFFVIKREE